MTDRREQLDALMEQASADLARMAYLPCEAKTIEALTLARESGAWAEYARILLPLQEARRQRRMIAAEGQIRLGSATLSGGPRQWLDACKAGCLCLTHPHTRHDAAETAKLVLERELYVEVLYADSSVGETSWTLRAWAGPEPPVSVTLPAPPQAWVDRTWSIGTEAPPAPGRPAQNPADWFLNAAEALGDAALERVDLSDPPRPEQVAELEACLEVVADHEILHQTLASVARKLRLTRPVE